MPEVRDQLLLPIAGALTADPADARGLDEWGRELGASARTLSRRFVADVGMPFGTWRRQVRLLAALERPAAGEPVGTVAFGVGYESVSAFIAAFTRSLAATPERWFRTLNRKASARDCHASGCVTRPRRPMLLTSNAITVTR